MMAGDVSPREAVHRWVAHGRRRRITLPQGFAVCQYGGRKPDQAFGPLVSAAGSESALHQSWGSADHAEFTLRGHCRGEHRAQWVIPESLSSACCGEVNYMISSNWKRFCCMNVDEAYCIAT